MQGSIFQPQLAERGSAVTPTEGVENRAAVIAAEAVTSTAVDAGLAYTRQDELSNLRTKFDRFKQLRQGGGNSSELQFKARSALNEAKANTPWASQQADELFREVFGGGSSGGSGVFAPTPEEKAASDYRERVANKQLTAQLSTPQEAAKRLALLDQAKDAKALADSQADSREANSDVIFHNTSMQLSTQSIAVSDAIDRALLSNNGTIKAEDGRVLINEVRNTKIRLEGELLRQTRDPQTGRPVVSKTSIDDNLKAIEEWEERTLARLQDNDYNKVITNINAEKNAEAQKIANDNYFTLKVLNAAGGESAVKAALDAIQRPEGVSKEFLKQYVNPITADFFKNPGDFRASTGGGFSKLLATKGTSFRLTEEEAFASGSVLSDPNNIEVTKGVVTEATNNDDSAKAIEDLTSKNPDAAVSVWSGRIKGFVDSLPDKGEKVLSSTLAGLRKNYQFAEVSNGQVVSNLKVGRVKHGRSSVLSGSGEGLTTDHQAAIRNTYGIFKAYPKLLEQFAKDNNIEGITPEIATEVFLGVTPVISEEFVEKSTKRSPVSRSDNLLNQVSELEKRSDELELKYTGSLASEQKPSLLQPNRRNRGDKVKGKGQKTKKVIFSEDDLLSMVNEGEITELDAILLKGRGLVGEGG